MVVHDVRRGFTLVELLVVITIILLVSAVVLPVVVPAFSHRQVSEGARLLQASLAGARDNAIRQGRPSGIRLLPDPVINGLNPATGQLDGNYPLACNRIVPLDLAPEYSEGAVSIIGTAGNAPFVAQPGLSLAQELAYPVGVGQSYPPAVLMVEESFYAPNSLQPNPPTSWAWNVRVGDKIQIGNAGPWYTIVGPMAIPPQGTTINKVFYANTEMFVNVGPPGVASPLVRPDGNGGTYQPEFLFLADGRDDNKNGWIDEGWDGVDNNGDGQVDEVAGPMGGEWETETWQGSAGPGVTANAPYAIRRRPAPSGTAREIPLPTNVVIDLTTWGSTQERSRCGAAFNPFTGYVDILVNPDGSIVPTTIYGTPASAGLSAAFVHLWLAERADVLTPSGTAAPLLPPGDFDPADFARAGIAPAPYAGPRLQGEFAIVTVGRYGKVGSIAGAGFDDPASPIGGSGAAYNPGWPFLRAQQGVVGQ